MSLLRSTRFFDSKVDSGMILERSFHNEYRERPSGPSMRRYSRYCNTLKIHNCTTPL